MRMNSFWFRCLPLFLGAWIACSPSFAGPVEDAEAAYQQGDYPTALRLLRPLAEKGNASAQTRLGVMYLAGRGVAEDPTEAARWIIQAAEQGHARAQALLGSMYATGTGVRNSGSESVKWYSKAAEQGDPAGQTGLGDKYFSGDSVREDKAEAAKWYRKAAEQGYAIAQFSLGAMLAKGEGVREDHTEALSWYHKAAEQGDYIAQHHLGVLYDTGSNVRQDSVEAVKWFSEAAEQGDPESQVYLGNMYAKGRGVQQDQIEAVKWYRTAAARGDANAQFNLGTAYKNGEGVRQDLAVAANWFLEAQSNPRAPWNLQRKAAEARSGLVAPISQSTQATAPLSVDHTPPTLSIHNGAAQTIEAPDWILQGKASDASGVAEVLVDGLAVAISRFGEFSVKRYIPVGETTLEIVATDIHGNRTTQRVTIARRAASHSVVSTEPVLTPPPAKSRANPHALALIVGVEDYRNAPRAKWAAQDARLFYDFAQNTLGIAPGNIKLLIGDQANRAGLLAALKTWLAPMITPGKSQVYVYFAGHGLAAPEGDKAYFIPQDGDPSLLEDTALDRQRLFDEITKAKPLSTTLFLDTCYSGTGRGGEGTLVANARPVLIKSKSSSLPSGFMQFSAASHDQLAHIHPSQQHGLFSYYLMRGMGGEADINRDNTLTAGELQDYLHDKVKRMSLTQGRMQEPELLGDRDRVIAVWNK